MNELKKAVEDLLNRYDEVPNVTGYQLLVAIERLREAYNVKTNKQKDSLVYIAQALNAFALEVPQTMHSSPESACL